MGRRCRPAPFGELSPAWEADLGRGKEVSPQPICKPAPQRMREFRIPGRGKPEVAPLAELAFSAVPPGMSARVAASSESKEKLGSSHGPPRAPETGLEGTGVQGLARPS